MYRLCFGAVIPAIDKAFQVDKVMAGTLFSATHALKVMKVAESQNELEHGAGNITQRTALEEVEELERSLELRRRYGSYFK